MDAREDYRRNLDRHFSGSRLRRAELDHEHDSERLVTHGLADGRSVRSHRRYRCVNSFHALRRRRALADPPAGALAWHTKPTGRLRTWRAAPFVVATGFRVAHYAAR